MKSVKEDMADKNVIELAAQFKTLRAKFLELDAKANIAFEAARLACDAMLEARQNLLATAAGVSIDEFISDESDDCPDCGEDH